MAWAAAKLHRWAGKRIVCLVGRYRHHGKKVEYQMHQHCCEALTAHVTATCHDHPDPFDCPDRLITYNADYHTYGLIIHDGGSSFVTIDYCPLCGTALPSADQASGEDTND